MIRKLKDGRYRLYSRKKNPKTGKRRNLGTFKTRAAAEKHERFSSVEELRHCLEEFMSGGGWFATRRFRAGEVIVREGEVGDSAYIITEGQCEVYRIEDGQKQPLHSPVQSCRRIFHEGRAVAGIGSLRDPH